MKIAINKCYGGFGLSDKAYDILIDKKGWKVTTWKNDEPKNPKAELIMWNKEDQPFHGKYTTGSIDKYENNFRTNPDVIWVIEKLGSKANSKLSELKIVEIPDDVEWTIEEYDGVEWIAEKHRTWG